MWQTATTNSKLTDIQLFVYLALASLAKSSSTLARVRVSESTLVWEGRERRRDGREVGGANVEGLAFSY